MTPSFDTLTFRRQLPAAPDRVFAAFKSVEARRIWGSPAPEVELVYDAADFREGAATCNAAWSAAGTR